MGSASSQKSQNMMDYQGASTYAERIAAHLHNQWREHRLENSKTKTFEDNKKYPPRYKQITGDKDKASKSSFVNARGLEDGKYDIANLDFKDLPYQTQESNLLAGEDAVQEILREVVETGVLGKKFIERSAHYQHQKWILRHQDSSDTHMLCPYYLLPSKEKSQVRGIIETAIKLYDPVVDRLSLMIFPPRESISFNDEDEGSENTLLRNKTHKSRDAAIEMTKMKHNHRKFKRMVSMHATSQKLVNDSSATDIETGLFVDGKRNAGGNSVITDADDTDKDLIDEDS